MVGEGTTFTFIPCADDDDDDDDDGDIDDDGVDDYDDDFVCDMNWTEFIFGCNQRNQ